MLRKVVVVLSFLVLSVSTRAQLLQTGVWHTYTSMRDVFDLAMNSDSSSVWVATPGGVFRIALDTNSAQTLELHNTEGLSEDSVTAIAADPDGNVYLGGFSGSFDIYTGLTGAIEQRSDIQASQQFSNKTINAIRVFGSRVYICTNYGLTIYNKNDDQFAETVSKFASLKSQEAVLSTLEFNGRSYAVLTDSVAVAPDTNLSAAWTTLQGTNGKLTSIALFRGSVCVGSTSGLYVLNAVKDSFEAVKFGQQISVSSLGVDPAMDSLYMIDAPGVNVMSTADLQTLNVRSAPIPGNGKRLTGFAFSRNHLVAYGSSNAGITLESEGSKPIESLYPPGPVSNSVVSLTFSSATGQLYSSHGGDGLSMFSPVPNVWKDFPANGISIPQFSYLYLLYDSIRSVLWASLDGSGLCKISGIGTPGMATTQIGAPPLSPTIAPGYVTMGSGIIDHLGNFVVADRSYQGMAIAKTSDGKTFQTFQAAPPASYYSFGDVAEDQDGNLWVGTSSNTEPPPYGVFFLRPDGGNGSITAGTAAVLPSPAVNALIVDQDDELWCGTNAGIEIISNISDVNSNLNPTFDGRGVGILTSQVIHCITVDGVNDKWIGTDNGVFVLSGDGSDSIAHYTVSNSPLISNKVLSIALDAPNGEAYLGTDNGISRVGTIYKQGEPDYSGIKVYPDPVVQSSTEIPQVYITGLVGGSTVKIYTVSGRLVATIDGTQLGSTITWQGLEDTGRQLASGVYIVSATSAETNETGQAKFVLIRKP